MVLKIRAKSESAAKACQLLEELQLLFVATLEEQTKASDFERVEWLRDAGQSGGGWRYEARSHGAFNRASINFSQVHYDHKPEKSLASATALSAIVHPFNPFSPSLHLHISWTEFKNGDGYWRLMADLNPGIEDNELTKTFRQNLQEVSGPLFNQAEKAGDQYFFIPAIGRHRGACHFYLEGYHSGSFEKDLVLSENMGKRVISEYCKIVQETSLKNPCPSSEDFRAQLEYHTLYFFQVLTLDRGTTAGLLVHDQNDLGVLGSLPASIDTSLLKLWCKNMPSPQNSLLEAIIDSLGEGTPLAVDHLVKEKIASIIREHYRKFPKALDLLATGGKIPQTGSQHYAQPRT